MNRLLLLLALLSGCASIDYKAGPVPGLEDMTVEKHRVDATEIYQRCSRCGKLGLELPTACTCVNFKTNHAVIWLPRDASRTTVEHEHAHAQGYDHEDGALRRQYAAWTKNGGRRIGLTARPADADASGDARLTKVSRLVSAPAN